MLNQVVLVGKVKELPVTKETTNGIKVATMVVEVERGFRNANGVLESDDFLVTLWRGIAEECQSSCHVGSLVGLKGRLQANNYNKEDSIYYKADIIAEKVSFLN